MLLASVNPEAAQAVGTIKKVGVGNNVLYHGRQGYVRQGRGHFPAIVLKQHQDDGSLDLLVIMEPEDMILEQRVAFRSHNQPHHCWSVLEDVPGASCPDDRIYEHISHQDSETSRLKEALGEMRQRIAALENRPKPGRPRKVVTPDEAGAE